MVILSWEDIQALSFQDGVFLFDSVINSHLVGALSNLTLAIKHETPTKGINFVIIRARCVGLATLNGFR
jgi:hypothetical protein